MGAESVYATVRVNPTGTEVDLQLQGTDIKRFRVPVEDLTPLEPVRQARHAPVKPAKRTDNVEEVRERLANVQHSSIDQLDGDIAILSKYLKSAAIKDRSTECVALTRPTGMPLLRQSLSYWNSRMSPSGVVRW
jgi:hypothetical protein